jgi:tripartite-type tricarboxylate transporter receptor subunit TctC
MKSFCIAFACLLLASTGMAQTYPERPVRIIVPFPAGGSNDVVARILGQRLSESAGYQIVIDNRGGAGGNIGAEAVAKAAPDGYTLLLTAPGPLTVNQSLFRTLPFDPMKDFAPVALIASVPIVLMVHPSIPARSLGELIDLAKQQPGKLNFGSSGNGSTNHLAGELLKSMAGIEIVHVPYRGAAPAMNDLVGGHIPMMFDNMPAVLPHAVAGSVRALAVAGAKRSTLLPDVPTVAEAGVPEFEASAWFGLVAPAGTSPAVLARITEAFTKALQAPDTAKKLIDLGAEPGTVSGEAFGAFLRAEAEKWAKVVQASGAKVE